MTLEAMALSHEEAVSAGLKPFVDGSFDESYDNYAVDGMLSNAGPTNQQDARGRAIISYKQYLEMKRRDMRLDNYVLRMHGRTGRGLIQASKFIKYWGEGYRPVEMVEAARKTARRQAEIAEDHAARTPTPLVVDDDQLVVYWCKQKFAGCPRFFDSMKALQTHWGMPAPSGHGEGKFKSKKAKVRPAIEADDDDLPVSFGP